MEDITQNVIEYLYYKTFLSFRAASKTYLNKLKAQYCHLRLNIYKQRARGESFLRRKSELFSIIYPPRLTRYNDTEENASYKYIPHHALDSLRRGPKELYETKYKPLIWNV